MPRTPSQPGDVPIDETAGPIPAANEPGHHPPVEQDKPIGRRPRPKKATKKATNKATNKATKKTKQQQQPRAAGQTASPGEGPDAAERFPFAFAGATGVAARAFVWTEDRAHVEVADGRMLVRYGPWSISTPLENIVGATLTGPYKLWKVAGPPHVSFADRGLTLATNRDRGVCIEFREPVPGLEPTGRVLHPGVTVTVADPEGLIAAITG